MKKQLHFITIILMLAGTLAAYAQNKSTLDDLYKVTDTINGEPRTIYYESEKIYESIQATKRKNIDALVEKKRIYESNQRTQLAERIEEIDERVNKIDAYTQEMAQRDKEGTAEQFAERINKHNRLIDAQIEFEKVTTKLSNGEGNAVVADFGDGVNIRIKNRNKEADKNVNTTSGLSLGFGYNFINGDDLGIDDFSYANNNYFSVGVYWLTALNKSQTVRFKYGIEYQSQGTELNGNRAFTISDPDNTQIQRLSFDADKAKFRQDQLVFPLHFEIGGTNRKEYEDGRVRFDNYKKFKIGLGGYAGFNMSSRLKYKYELSGDDIKQTTINAFDNNVLLYGVDAYVGIDDFSIFGRMALNDIFDTGSVDGQYMAFGVRWNW
ncbi:porin family protein [Nonlabens marinus]|uniref:Outer membrane protein beta-barrel domain-containing protein n=1 Tax=Nonlabens marinus S1-08 TaxID=1454201 RepID=W8VZC7_9FLAO|nr:hypothetical protein [Nonlabens marinus]BAO54346.1 hypothetical protein NMS_0337 [Nonlabens marinus S1-08]